MEKRYFFETEQHMMNAISGNNALYSFTGNTFFMKFCLFIRCGLSSVARTSRHDTFVTIQKQILEALVYTIEKIVVSKGSKRMMLMHSTISRAYGTNRNTVTLLAVRKESLLRISQSFVEYIDNFHDLLMELEPFQNLHEDIKAHSKKCYKEIIQYAKPSSQMLFFSEEEKESLRKCFQFRPRSKVLRAAYRSSALEYLKWSKDKNIPDIDMHEPKMENGIPTVGKTLICLIPLWNHLKDPGNTNFQERVDKVRHDVK
eukprot:Nk52_evm1s472 gene=Nk52_evmTU1s472